MPYLQRQLPDQGSPYAYELPGQRYLAQPPAPGVEQPGPYQPSLPVGGPGEALAEVEGLTDRYFDTYGKLKAYADSMWKEFKVDVTQPDISQPGGGVPFKSYQRLEAQLMQTANRLGNKQKETVQMRPYVATGQVTQKGDRYETQAILPEVEDILNKLKGPFYNQQEAERAKERLVGPMLQQLLQRGDLDDPLVRHNIEVLRGANTTYSTYPGLYTFQPREDKTEAAKQKAQLKALAGASREIGGVKRFTSLKNGFWEPGSYQMAPDAEGKPQLINRAHEGEQFGSVMIADNSTGDMAGKKVNRIIDGWVRKPDKTVWMTFKVDPETGETPPPIRVDNVDGADITTQFQQSNSKFGQAQPTFQAIDILGWADPNNVGTLNEQAMYNAQDSTGFETLSKARDLMDSDLNTRGTKVSELRSQLQGLVDSGSIFSRQSLDISLPDGSKVTVKTNKTNDNLRIEGVGEDLSLQQVENYLASKGYFNAPAATAPQSNAPVLSPEEFNSKWGTLKPGDTLRGPDGKIYIK